MEKFLEAFLTAITKFELGSLHVEHQFLSWLTALTKTLAKPQK